jgi:hypothetical protein
LKGRRERSPQWLPHSFQEIEASMSPIHKKSALNQSTSLILAATDQGEGLLWGRYEAQLPLCAFTANGLNCRRCFQGPCRINPFGDEPRHGVCGADRDQIVMETLFQATLNGVLETARSTSLLDESVIQQELPDPSPDLPPETRERLSGQGILPVRKDQLLGIQNSFFSHKKYLGRTLKDLTRLGLINYGLLKGLERLQDSLPGHAPSFSPEGANLLFLGQAGLKGLLALRERIEKGPEGQKVNLWLQGARGLPVFPSLADQGSPEMALAMNLDALIILSDAGLPSLPELAQKWEIPVVVEEEGKTAEDLFRKALRLALDHQKKKSYLTPTRIPQPPSGDPVFPGTEETRADLKAGRAKGVLVLWGEPNPQQTFFDRTLTLMEMALEEKLLVFIGGDLAAQGESLREEWSRKAGKKNADPSESFPFDSVRFLRSCADIPKLVAFMRALNPEKEFHQMPVVLSFTEFFRASTWAAAVTFLSLGFAVQVGIKLPFWGSLFLSEVLLKDWPQISGGILLASPGLPDAQTQAREIIAHIRSRSIEG